MSLNTKAFTTEDWQAKRDQFVARGVSNGNRHLAAKGKVPFYMILTDAVLSILPGRSAH